MSTLRILIADDHEVVRRGLRTLLESERGWQVVGEAADGREALDLALNLKPDLAIVDLSMPEINGVDLTRRLRRSLPRLEVLVLTVHESAQLAREVAAAGARGYVLKSDASRNLIAAVHAVGAHRQFVSPRLSETRPTEETGPPRAGFRERITPPACLTVREMEVVHLLASGRSNRDIATALSISNKTVEAHRANVMRKLRITGVADLVRWAVRAGIVDA